MGNRCSSRIIRHVATSTLPHGNDAESTSSAENESLFPINPSAPYHGSPVTNSVPSSTHTLRHVVTNAENITRTTGNMETLRRIIQTTHLGMHLPLHTVCNGAYSDELIRIVMRAFPSMASSIDADGMFPMDLYARRPSANNQTLKLLVPARPFGFYASSTATLHSLPSIAWVEKLAGALRCSIRQGKTLSDVQQGHRIFQAEKYQPLAQRVLLTRHAYGFLPLHLAIQHPGTSLTIAQYFLTICPQSAKESTTSTGRTALSLCCDRSELQEYNYSIAFLMQFLVSIYPEALSTPCKEGLYPLDYACRSGAHPRIISVLTQDAVDLATTRVILDDADLATARLRLAQDDADLATDPFRLAREDADLATARFMLAQDDADLVMARFGKPDVSIRAAVGSDESSPAVSIRECCICLEPLEAGVSRTKCGHDFHTACIRKMPERQMCCPLCRTAMRRADLSSIR